MSIEYIIPFKKIEKNSNKLEIVNYSIQTYRNIMQKLLYFRIKIFFFYDIIFSPNMIKVSRKN